MQSEPTGDATGAAFLPGRHDHRFGQDRVRPAQGRTAFVLGLTVVMRAGEIVAGLAFGSIALLADGLHMGSHAAALGVALLAYALTRRYANDRRLWAAEMTVQAPDPHSANGYRARLRTAWGLVHVLIKVRAGVTSAGEHR